jgi:hypothetical protein
VQRLQAISEVMTKAKGERSVAAMGSLASGARLVPTPLLTHVGKWVTSNIDLVLSNLRAAPFDTFMGGALVEGQLPAGSADRGGGERHHHELSRRDERWDPRRYRRRSSDPINSPRRSLTPLTC